jgi:hypothetical protein
MPNYLLTSKKGALEATTELQRIDCSDLPCQLAAAEASSRVGLVSMVLNITATFFRKLGDAISSTLLFAFMLRIWLAEHERVSSCSGLLDFPLASELELRGLSCDWLCVGHVMLLLDDIESPYSNNAAC